MERPPVFSLDVLADRSLVKDIVKGVISTIFFHRFFPTVRPKTRDLLDLTLPAVDDPELEELIDQRTNILIKSIEASAGVGTKPQRGQVAVYTVEFYERRPKKNWFSKAEEKVCWEQWVLSVTVVSARTDAERMKLRTSMETQLQAAVLNIITTASMKKDHIPPITTNEANPFPYSIIVSPKGETWGARMGIFSN
ncbi:DUF1649-domain-containing protein [Choiromyces venosus 120613-1]|uniref:Autophagy-related protein 101 n=1 Tax=Choiromyces venosus 120613-1 TaxID=1336337 RepID=A0A3N4K5B2_9PEZI|nr:DUF1649-domain-containing protein [Choiromyces venosus 120613-1]